LTVSLPFRNQEKFIDVDRNVTSKRTNVTSQSVRRSEIVEWRSNRRGNTVLIDTAIERSLPIITINVMAKKKKKKKKERKKKKKEKKRKRERKKRRKD